MSATSDRVYPQGDKYADLVRTYYEGITRTHPDYVTSRGQLCGDWEYWCDWAATSVDYYEYRGESL
jgi:hypothetical protein